MSIRAIIHVVNEDPVLADLEAIPDAKDNFLVVRNPRRRDGKALTLLADGVTTLLYPWTRITYVEILDEAGFTSARESIVGFFRENDRLSHGP